MGLVLLPTRYLVRFVSSKAIRIEEFDYDDAEINFETVILYDLFYHLYIMYIRIMIELIQSLKKKLMKYGQKR